MNIQIAPIKLRQ